MSCAERMYMLFVCICISFIPLLIFRRSRVFRLVMTINISLFKTTYPHDHFLIRKIINFITMMINQSEQNLSNTIFFYNYSEIAISNAKLTKKTK